MTAAQALHGPLNAVTDNGMSEGISKPDMRLERMALKLRCDVSPETDLWPRIAARIDTPAERSFRRLPRDVEVPRDLWPSIHARLRAYGRVDGASSPPGFRFTRVVAGVGILAVAAIALLISTPVENPTRPVSVTASASELPVWMADMLGRFAGETAVSIGRDFLMVRSERLRIEQALATSANDTNLRTQWRHVYLAELRLIDEAQKLGNMYGTRSEI
jgi:hypothetical protein